MNPKQPIQIVATLLSAGGDKGLRTSAAEALAKIKPSFERHASLCERASVALDQGDADHALALLAQAKEESAKWKREHPIAFYAARERGRLVPRVDIIGGPFATLAEAAGKAGVAPESAQVVAGRVDADPDPRIDGCLVGLVFA